MVIEAFACRVPVVGSDSGEIPHVVGDAGMIIPETDVDGWARAIQLMLDDPLHRDELAERGFVRCRKEYETSRIAQQYVSLYHDLCRKSDSPCSE